jgi:hypothetical protein
MTFTSIGAQDGWILESGENTNVGGSKNATRTFFTLGDDAANKQFRAILSFNTAGLPAGATITNITLKIRQADTRRFPRLLNIAVDIKKGNFGLAPLQLGDFSSKPTKKVAFAIPNNKDVNGWYTGTLGAIADTLVNKAGNTQFRLRFSRDDNNNRIANIIRFFSGNALTPADQPQLIITYYLP